MPRVLGHRPSSIGARPRRAPLPSHGILGTQSREDPRRDAGRASDESSPAPVRQDDPTSAAGPRRHHPGRLRTRSSRSPACRLRRRAGLLRLRRGQAAHAHKCRSAAEARASEHATPRAALPCGVAAEQRSDVRPARAARGEGHEMIALSTRAGAAPAATPQTGSVVSRAKERVGTWRRKRETWTSERVDERGQGPRAFAMDWRALGSNTSALPSITSRTPAHRHLWSALERGIGGLGNASDMNTDQQLPQVRIQRNRNAAS